MPLTINGVQVTVFAENDGGGALAESVPAHGPTASVQFKCPYERRWDVIKGLLGSVTTVGNQIVRTPPLAYPPLPTLFCVSIGAIKGIKFRTDATGWPIYESAIVPANFALPQYQFSGPEAAGGVVQDPSQLPYTRTRIRTSAEVFSPPGGSYYFPDGTPVRESGVGLVRSRAEISMTRHLMPYVPLNSSLYQQGTLNNTPVTFADHSFPRGCLLYVGMTVSEGRSDPSTGLLVYDIEFSFLGNRFVEWNQFMAKDGTYQYINSQSDGSGRRPFFYSSFDIFFSQDLFTFTNDANRVYYF